MKKIYLVALSLFGVLVWTSGVWAQISFDRIRNDDAIKNLLKAQTGKSLKTSIKNNPLDNKLPGNIASVNEDEYVVDAGDQFVIKIDTKGPSFKMYEPIVTPDGFLMIPEGPTVQVRYLLLKEAKKKINKALNAVFPDAVNESYLSGIHPVSVNVIGSLPNSAQVTLLSGNRVSDAVFMALKPFLQDEKFLPQLKTMSLRNITIMRHNKQVTCDLGKFLATGNVQTNPYVMDQDVIYMAYKDTLFKTILISGAVSKETEFEFKPGDDLYTAIAFAGGLTSIADSAKIELVRFLSDGSQYRSFNLSFPQDAAFTLQADDRIFVRPKYDFHKKATVRVSGAVKFPGDYAIAEGKTKLSEVVALAGGLTPKASLGDARIIRDKQEEAEDPELKRLGKVYMNEMDKIEKSYFRLRGREIAHLVACDFKKLFSENNSDEDVLLKDGDEIVIPEALKTVYVSGGVMKPGAVLFKPGMTYESYIERAGGFNSRARTYSVILIKGRSGSWIEADNDLPVEAGDTIFVPENAYWDWYEIFKDGLTITAQLISIFVLLRSIK